MLFRSAKLADGGKLHEPAILRAQVQRMLKDRRSRALFDGFGAQWLELGNLATKTFDTFEEAVAGLPTEVQSLPPPGYEAEPGSTRRWSVPWRDSSMKRRCGVCSRAPTRECSSRPTSRKNGCWRRTRTESIRSPRPSPW